MLGEAEICLDHADLLVLEFVIQHDLVIADVVKVDVGEIEHADGHLRITQLALLFKNGLDGLV